MFNYLGLSIWWLYLMVRLAIVFAAFVLASSSGASV
jgi:hypothetical protein